MKCDPSAGLVLKHEVSETTDKYQVFMGQPPSPEQAREVFASNGSDKFFNLWNQQLRTHYDSINTSTVGIRDDLWGVYDDDSNYCVTSQGAPQYPLSQNVPYTPNTPKDGSLILPNWFSGPCIKSGPGKCKYNVLSPLHLNFSSSGSNYAVDGEIGALGGAGVQGKENLIPFLNPQGQNDGLAIISASEASDGGRALQMKCHLIKKDGALDWTPGLCGSFITAQKFASGEFTVRAKVTNQPALIWALWTFYGNYNTPAARLMKQCGDGSDCNACLGCGFWEDCCEKRYHQTCNSSIVTGCGASGNETHWTCKNGTCTPKSNSCTDDTDCDSLGQACLENGSTHACGLSCTTVNSVCSKSMNASECDRQHGYGNTSMCNPKYSLDPMWPYHVLENMSAQNLFTLGGAPCALNPNHEIDIELPSNAPQVVHSCTNDNPCTGLVATNTLNINTYRWTNSAGTGTYNNLFVMRNDSAGNPKPFLDDKYHTYTFKWHTGTFADRSNTKMLPPYDDEPSTCDPTGEDQSKQCEYIRPRVDFYYDDVYIGTNDAMVPTIAGRYWVQQWFKAKDTGGWNGLVDKTQCSGVGPCSYGEVLIDYVTIKPYHQERDVYFAEIIDQPQMIDQYEKPAAACSMYKLVNSNSSITYRAANHLGAACEYGLPIQSTQSFVPFVSDNRNLIGSICDTTNNVDCSSHLIKNASDCKHNSSYKNNACDCNGSWAGPDCNTPCPFNCSEMKYACGTVCGDFCGHNSSNGSTCANHQYVDTCKLNHCYNTSECVQVEYNDKTLECQNCIASYMPGSSPKKPTCYLNTFNLLHSDDPTTYNAISSMFDCDGSKNLAVLNHTDIQNAMTTVCKKDSGDTKTYYCKPNGDCKANK